MANRLKDQTYRHLAYDEVLAFFAQKAQTKLGKDGVLALGLLPEKNRRTHYEKLSHWVAWLESKGSFRFPAIPAPDDFDRKPQFNPFGAKALRNLRDVLVFWCELRNDDTMAALLPPMSDAPPLDGLAKRLDGLFERNGDWRDDVSPTYARLIQKYRQTDGRIDQTLQQLIRTHRAHLSEALAFTRNNRRVLAVKQDFKGKVNGILQDYSGSGHTVFIEPDAIVQIQNQLSQLDFEIREELFRIRCELTTEVLTFPEIWQVICPHLGEMDTMQALAAAAKDTGCIVCCPNTDHILDLRDARHPFLDEAFASYRQVTRELEAPDQNNMVPFQLSLDGQHRGLIISGANAGGKTVTLKTTGLLAWMANSGLPVPVASGSAIPVYHHIYADIGDNQSLSHNLSTYASHLESMKQLLALDSGPKLLLLDELGSGTDPQEGNALAQALIETMVHQPNHLLVTTHQQILCTLALNHPHLDNGSMVFDRQRLRPTYKFRQGVPGRSHALDMAGNIGLPATVLERAKSLIDDSQLDIQEAIRQLQEKSRDLEKQKASFRKQERRLLRRIADTKKETDALKKEREDLKTAERRKLKKTIETAERELRQVLRDAGTRKQAKRSLADFKAVSKSILPELPEKLEDEPVAADSKPMDQWQAGDLVYLPGWRMTGQLVSFDRKKALVNCNGKQLHCDSAGILHLEDQRTGPATVSDHVESVSDEAVTLELNLLGFRVEDAISEIDRHLDQAMRKHSPFLKIIHGHGTGALKSGVREFLRTHPARASFRLNIEPENDGVTEIQFTD